MAKSLSKRQFDRLIPWGVPILLVILWQVLSQSGILPARILPAPLSVVHAGINLATTGELTRNILVSTVRAFVGFLTLLQ